MPNYISLSGRTFLLSDDPNKAATEVVAVKAISVASSDSQVFTTIDATDATVASIIINP